MNKENINMSFSHLLRESRNWIPGTSPRMTLESGRTLLELIMTLAVIGILAMGAIKFYKHTVNKVKAQNTAKMIKTIAFERQNMALRQESNLETTVKGPHSALHVKNGTSGNHQSYFWVETTLSDKDFCDSLKESGFIQAEFVEVDGVTDGNCRDHSKLAFYFKKNPNAQVYCPSHSTNCDDFGDATGCEDGYYLDGGICSACGEHVATCEDENTPLTCEEGYNLYGTECLSYTPCERHADCDSCGTCQIIDGDTQGICVGECDSACQAGDACGENDCIICDSTTQTCQNKCTEVGYLESDGTQFILTGFVPTETSEWEIELSSTKTSTSWAMGCPTWVGVHYKGTNGQVGITNSSTSAFLQYVNYPRDNTKITLKLSGDTVYADGVSLGTITRRASTLDLALFGYRDSNMGASLRFSGSIYKVKLWDNAVLVRDFIPVLSPTESEHAGKPCMFDKVTKKLFCNAGTGEFLTD